MQGQRGTADNHQVPPRATEEHLRREGGIIMGRTWLAVDKDGTEKIFNVSPFRGNTQEDKDHVWGTYVGENYKKWYPEHDERNDDTGDPYYLGYSIELPKGTISKLIGRGLSWEDEPVELREE